MTLPSALAFFVTIVVVQAETAECPGNPQAASKAASFFMFGIFVLLLLFVLYPKL
jgi:flagellar biogenesis protein FliO